MAQDYATRQKALLNQAIKEASSPALAMGYMGPLAEVHIFLEEPQTAVEIVSKSAEALRASGLSRNSCTASTSTSSSAIAHASQATSVCCATSLPSCVPRGNQRTFHEPMRGAR